jgi:hypothetical protein
MRPANNWRALVLGAAGLVLAGCSTVQPAAFPIGSQHRPPKPATAAIQWFRETPPTRPYSPVARLNVHIEKTFLIPTAFAEAQPQLEDLARRQGADAIMDVQEKKSRLNETYIYNVSAVAIAYTD